MNLGDAVAATIFAHLRSPAPVLLLGWRVTLKATRARRSRTRQSIVLARKNALRGKSIAELIREQGVKPFDPKVFEGGFPPGEDIDAFLDTIYRARR